MAQGEYWFIHFWGEYEGHEVKTYLCSTKCCMELNARELKHEHKVKREKHRKTF